MFSGGSTFLDRGVCDGSMLEPEYLARSAPDAHCPKLADGHLRGIEEQEPHRHYASMRVASDAVIELIARMFPFRHAPNKSYACSGFMLADRDCNIVVESDFNISGTYPVSVGA